VHLSIFAKVMGIVLIGKWLFVTTVISQGSVATRLRCGGQCDSQFVANFVLNSKMEKFRKSVNICQSYGQKYRGPFYDSQCRSTCSVHNNYSMCPCQERHRVFSPEYQRIKINLYDNGHTFTEKVS